MKSSSNVVRIPVRVCNLSAHPVHIPPRSLLCSLTSVSVVDSWTLDLSHKQESKSNVSSLEDLGVQIDTDNLSPEELGEAKGLFNKWSDIFSTSVTDLGRTDTVKHEIKLTDNTPFKEPYRRIPPALYDEVCLHFCIDFRKLNSRIDRDAYTLPCIDDTMDTLMGARYFSKLDLRSGYWQVEIKEEDKEKTAFTVGNLGFYECNRMAFGLTNAPATFQRLMERCMGELNLKECLIFLDDILVYSETFIEHLNRLEAVFSRRQSACLVLNPITVYSYGFLFNCTTVGQASDSMTALT